MVGRAAPGLTCAGLAWLLTGCSSCEDDAAEAQAFFSKPANLACQSDADCLIVITGCSQIPASHCGQTPLNARASRSHELAEHRENLAACAEDSCIQCSAVFHAECLNGSCTAVAGFSK